MQKRASPPRTERRSNKSRRLTRGTSTAPKTRKHRTSHGGITYRHDAKTPLMIPLKISPAGYAYIVIKG